MFIPAFQVELYNLDANQVQNIAGWIPLPIFISHQ